MAGVNGLTEFLESSTIHGLSYIAGNRRLVRLFWVSVVIAGFTGAVILIQQSFSSWADSPISTTIESLPISDLEFPNVTVCPPKNSFTSLNPDLLRSRNVNFDEEKRKEFSDSVLDALFGASLNSKYKEFIEYRQDKYIDWYTGTSSISFPWDFRTFGVSEKIYDVKTTRPSGSFSTPYFRKSFSDQNFEKYSTNELMIYVPADMNNNASQIIEIDMDIGEETFDTIKVEITTVENDKTDIKVEYIRQNERDYQIVLTPLPRSVCLKYSRTIYEDDYLTWKNKRHTGMTVSWRYEIPPQEEAEPYYRFTEDNKYFALLANIIQEHGGVNQDMEDVLREIREKEKLVNHDKCTTGLLSNNMKQIIKKTFRNISYEAAVYKEEISEEDLEIAARVYFEMASCPSIDFQTFDFYQNLFENFPLETVLKTLARILLEANDKSLTEQYQAAKTLFDKITEMMNLQYRDIAVITTGLLDLEMYPQLKDHQLNQEIQSFPNIEELINHPVHLNGELKSTAFIPFCSFGESMELFGEELPNFQIPVCRLFRKKIVNGQICYEADLNQYRDRVKWKEALSSGLNLIIDTNDEYDVKNIIPKISGKKKIGRSFNSYKHKKKDKSLIVMLKTINPVPIILDGEGHYALTDIKDIRVTEDFVGLGEKITKCQTKEFRTDCVSRKHREQVLQSCKCSPVNMRSYYGNSTKTCSPSELDCIANLEEAADDCLEYCEGIIVDVGRLHSEKEGLADMISDYEKFKYPHSDNLTYPHSMKELEFNNKLKFVQISFSTSTFDRITKDRAAKFVDQLSAIGGTMGLLTGFSLISGVEIIYFVVKIVWKIIQPTL